MKRLYDRSTNVYSYNAGDDVWFYNPLRTKGLNPQFQRPWQGPVLVTERINDVIYMNKRSPRAKPKVVHHDRLKLNIGEQTFFSKCQGLKISKQIYRINSNCSKLLELLRLHFQNIYLHVFLHGFEWR